MALPSLQIFDSIDDLTNSLRFYILSAQQKSISRNGHGRFRIAVSGGSMPKMLGSALLQKPTSSDPDEIQYDKWSVFFTDERCVPLTHDDSNYKAIKDHWIDKIPEGVTRPTIFPIDESVLGDAGQKVVSEESLDDAADEIADRYNQDLLKEFAARDSVKFPMFDLILLGCGPDGHTCSLFPGKESLTETISWILPITDSPKPPSRRVTFSLPVASHGIQIAFVATGESKREIMHQIFDTEEGKKLPCGLINEAAQDKVTWFTDSGATELVKYRSARRNSAVGR